MLGLRPPPIKGSSRFLPRLASLFVVANSTIWAPKHERREMYGLASERDDLAVFIMPGGAGRRFCPLSTEARDLVAVRALEAQGMDGEA